MDKVNETELEIDKDVSKEEFQNSIESKMEHMGNLIDEEVAKELVEYEQSGASQLLIKDIKLCKDKDVRFIGKITSIGEMHEFDREGEKEKGQVVNIELADESGSVRGAFWDDYAKAVLEELEVGQVLRVQGKLKRDGENVEINIVRSLVDPDLEIKVDEEKEYKINNLSSGATNVRVIGRVLSVESERIFKRKDGGEGKVSSLTMSDETGRIRLVLWDRQTEIISSVKSGDSIEITKGYIRERDSQIELHIGKGGAVKMMQDTVEINISSTKINTLEIGQSVDVSGTVIVADPKRIFDRKDGTKGQLKNVRIRDDTGEIRVTLWGEKADIEIGPGDQLLCTDIMVKEGWQEDLEISTNWKTSISVMEGSEE